MASPPIPPDRLLLLALFLLSFLSSVKSLYDYEDIKIAPLDNAPKQVTYDGRSLMLNGKRELFFCGSVHYPRAQPEFWDDILTKARLGGLNCIQTYVFWNVHEPEKGQFNFTGIGDVILFFKKIAEHGMYAVLRVGPFVQGEWNHGGLPYWLREEKDIIFRTDNPAWKKCMEDWTVRVLNMMTENKLFAPQGGPIILAQIENEYDHVKAAFKGFARTYIKWSANMAKNIYDGVPWIMCKQKDAPFDVINACNGRQCADTFPGPNAPNKPMLWTENWTAQYRVFGDAPSKRPAEDIAFSVARWFSINGSHVAYYMFYGGTSYGRTSAAFVTTRYYDEAPLDEFVLIREPKYSHLKDLHYTLEMSKNALWGKYTYESYGPFTEARFYEKPEENACAAFLWNNNTHIAETIKFKGKDFVVPPRSISILPDCKTIVYNTNTINSQHNSRNFTTSEVVKRGLKWEMTTEPVPEKGEKFDVSPLEQFACTRDKSDYLWYMTSIELDAYDLPQRRSIQPVFELLSLGHAAMLFVNGRFIGTEHGSKKQPKISYYKAAQLHEGTNHFAILHATVGMPDSGAYMEHRYSGLKTLIVQGLGTGNLDLTRNGWNHKVGLEGERLDYFTEEGSSKAKWVPVRGRIPPLTWYKARFDAPEGSGPLAIRMDNMTKGMVWINGKSIGRYWANFLSAMGKPSQDEYHIPRAFIKPKDNLIVIFDEMGGMVEKVEIQVVDRDVICSWISESYPPHVSNWKMDEKNVLTAVNSDLRPKARLQCPKGNVIKLIEFASYGDPWGSCGLFKDTECHAQSSKKVVEEMCLGKEKCEVPVDKAIFHPEDPCPKVKEKTLAVQARCGPAP